MFSYGGGNGGMVPPPGSGMNFSTLPLPMPQPQMGGAGPMSSFGWGTPPPSGAGPAGFMPGEQPTIGQSWSSFGGKIPSMDQLRQQQQRQQQLVNQRMMQLGQPNQNAMQNANPMARFMRPGGTLDVNRYNHWAHNNGGSPINRSAYWQAQNANSGTGIDAVMSMLPGLMQNGSGDAAGGMQIALPRTGYQAPPASFSTLPLAQGGYPMRPEGGFRGW